MLEIEIKTHTCISYLSYKFLQMASNKVYA